MDQHRSRRAGAAAFLVAALAACGGGGGTGAVAGGPLPAGANATVVRVVDGDTIVAKVAGSQEKVRLIGIDTPETKKPDTPVECYGEQAAARTAQLLPPGTPVRLTRDKETRDRYGRLLAYVERAADGLFVEATLVREGLAAPLEIRPNTAHAVELAALAAEARHAGRGLWSACGGPHVTAGPVGS